MIIFSPALYCMVINVCFINLCFSTKSVTSEEWKTVEELQQEVCRLEATLSTGIALDVTVLKDNNKLARLYTGMPTYDSFLAFVEYLEPKAKR